MDEQYRFPFLAPFQLSKLSGRTFEGINAGVRGNTSHDSLALYLNHPSPEIPQARFVVVMHNINDRLRLTLDDSYKSTINNASEATVGGLRESLSHLISNTWEWARLNSNLIFLVDAVFSRLKTDAREYGIQVTEKSLEKYAGVALGRSELFEQSLRNLVAVIKANRQTPVLMTQPLGRVSTDQDAFNDVIRLIAKTESIGLIDLARSIEEVTNRKALFYDDDIHFNNSGSKWASDEIARAFMSLLGLHITSRRIDQGACEDIRIDRKSLLEAPLHEDVLRGRYPSFDQAEKRILFQRNNSSGSSIAVIELDAGKTDELVSSNDPNGLEHPTWVDDKSIIFTERSGENRRLWIFNLIDRSKKELLSDKKLQGAIANVGLDGKVYFSGYRRADQKPPALYMLGKQGEVPTLLTPHVNESWRPFASASGEVFFINNQTGRYQIYSKRVDAPLRDSRLVSPSVHEQWDPAVSPDGLTLAFAQREGGNFDLYVMRIGAGSERPVRLVSSAEDEWDPRFSPSGRYILYAATSPHGDQIRAACIK